MPNKNIFQQRIRPVLPRILQDERVFVYVPKASSTSAGVAYFPDEEFTTAADGKITLKWPMSLQVENNKVNNPLETIARVKVSNTEFVNTNEISEITHPTTNKKYANTKSAIKFKRTDQDLFVKPGFMMVSNDDFEKEEVDSGDIQDTGRYVKYKLKKNNPLEKASLVKLNNQDFSYTNEAVIRWPYAHDPATGTDRTNEYGLVKIKPNSQGYLRYDNGYLEIDTPALKATGDIDSDIVPTYGGIEDGFEDYTNYVGPDGLAKRDANDNILLKLTKDAIGLSKVQNKAFGDYIFTDFGQNMQNFFNQKFDSKVSVEEYNKLFGDWSEPAGTTVQKIVTNLRDEDEAIRDAMRTNRSFLGFFEDLQDLENTYTPGEWTFGSTAFIRATKSYWRVRPNNVNSIVEDRVPVKADIPAELLKTTTYRIGRRDTQQVYQWNGSSFVLTSLPLKWVDIVLANNEDIQPYINGHASQHFVVGYRIGCRETGVVIRYTGTQWVADGAMYYEWADAYITSMIWNSFIETDPSILKPDGVANVGTSGKWVSSDHVHPTDITRLAKDTFDATNITVNTAFNNNSVDDFKITLADGGDKILHIPYVRLSQSIHNWNGQTTFIDSETSENYYWAGTQEEFDAQRDSIKNRSFVLVDDGEQLTPQNFVSESELNVAGITINRINQIDKFVTTKSNEAGSLINVPLTLSEVETPDGEKRYYLKNLISEGIPDGQILITRVIDGAAPTVDFYRNTNNIQNTVLGFNTNGKLVQRVEENYVTKANTFTPNKLIVSNGERNVKTLTTIDSVVGGIVVADGTGAIKSTSFTKAGRLLQTAGATGEKLAAGIEVSKLVTAEPDEFNTTGIVVSNAIGGIERQALGLLPNKLIVTDGSNGLRVQNIEAESLLYINNNGQVSAFPTTTNDIGKVLMVQSNGKVAVQSLPLEPTHLPVTTLGDTTSGTKLSFGETTIFEEGVLYLW